MDTKLVMAATAIILLFNCSGNPKTIDERLVGRWNGYLIDLENGEKIEPLVMEFTIDKAYNQFIYVGGELQNFMTGTFWTKGNTIYVKTPYRKKIEKVEYEVKDNKLIIINNGITNEFVKN